jgi:L-threonylcarbamoyladenylate synthase
VGTDLEYAATLLRQSGVVAFPTETVYGLGAHARDADAVARVFDVKGRPRFDPLIVHVATPEDVAQVAASFPEMARELARNFWPGPLTLILPKAPSIPDLVTAGMGTVGIRVPAHPMALELLKRAAVPVAAPSANRFGSISPTTAAHVLGPLGDQIDYLVDGGPCDVGIESTIVHLGTSPASVLRLGGVSLEDLEDVIGPVRHDVSRTADSAEPQLSPGRLERHYSPDTPLQIVATLPEPPVGGRVGLLTYQPVDDATGWAAVEVLSSSGCLREAAAHFYAALRRLDSLDLDRIVALRFPERSLGRALNDRLRRAAAPSDT